MVTATADVLPDRPRVVALGGGHGLHASLSALRLLTDDITAIVTVADDGGSSGRIRRELPVLPPGDLRMALSALAGTTPEYAQWNDVFQHRLGGSGVLAGHPIGNLLLTGLFESGGDAVAALAIAGRLLGVTGRVLPMSCVPLDLVAEVESVDRDDPVRTRIIRGQQAVATTTGRVRSVRLVPSDAPACPEAIDAILAADAVVLGPGSWFSSVLPHVLLPQIGAALRETSARVIVTLNLDPQVGETEGFSPEEHLSVLQQHAKDLQVDVVVADDERVVDRYALEARVRQLGGRLVLSSVASNVAAGAHDPAALARAYCQAFGSEEFAWQ
jgi:uncharacterized cofD-like protein